MKKYLVLSTILFAIIINYNCKKSDENTTNSLTETLNLPSQPYDYSQVKDARGISHEVKYENGSLVNSKMATIGRVLFYDKALSINNSIACASCHLQQNAFADVKALSRGFNEKITIRNSIGITNLTDEIGIGYFWDARQHKIEDMVFEPVANHIEMGFTRVDLMAEKLSNLRYYKALFKDCYGTEEITEAKLRKCLGNFLFSIQSNNSKFENINSLKLGSFTAEEKKGLDLFKQCGCNSCHKIGEGFPTGYGSSNNNNFANNGLDEVNKDKGINGLYKIPRLFNISKTAPYMHDGRFATLEQVIDHYSNGMKGNSNLSFQLANTTSGGSREPKRFNFSDSDKAALVAFLKTLDDEVLLTDEKFSSPFKN